MENGEYQIQINGIFHWVKVEGVENHTRPLVILHGGPGGNHYTFERTVGPLLSKSRTVVYYEQRGCGRSEQPKSKYDYKIEQLIDDFIGILNWLEVEKVDLLGYSFGGELALEVTLAVPKSIGNIILSAPSLMTSPIMKLVQLTGFLSVATNEILEKIEHIIQQPLSLNQMYEQIWGIVDTETVDRLLFENQDNAQLNRVLWEESNLNNSGLMMDIIHQYPPKTPLRNRLKDIPHRLLILVGAFDRNTGIPIAKIMHRELLNSELFVLNNSAHFPDIEETDKYLHKVLSFLNDSII